ALMQNVLADLALETEAATLLAFRLARAFDRSGDDAQERLFARLATPVAKYWLCKRTPAVALEAMECLGGNGYVEEAPLARLYRDAPVNGIWEGSGNVICLDVLRSMQREPESLEALMREIASAGASYQTLAARIAQELKSWETIERRARRLVEMLAIALQ